MIGKGTSPKQAALKLRESLAARGRLALLPRIARAFARYAARERAKNILTLSVDLSGAAHAKREAKSVLSGMHIDEADVETVVDESLIGGWRLEGREYLYDMSYKKFLLGMYNRLTNKQ
jgi:F0F1-type ATP synthase delta subunit